MILKKRRLRAFQVLFCLVLFLFPFKATASNAVAVAFRLKGKVKLYKKGSFKGFFVLNDSKLFVGDVLRTFQDSQALTVFKNGDRVVLSGKTSLLVKASNLVSPLSGTVFFKIRKGTKGLKIETNGVSIGVKGTLFAVRVGNGSVEVFVNEGTVWVKKQSGEFKRYRNEFESYKRRQREEFENYEEKIKKEFYEYVKSFDIKAGKAVVISGETVRQISTPHDIQRGFERMKRLLSKVFLQ